MTIINTFIFITIKCWRNPTYDEKLYGFSLIRKLRIRCGKTFFMWKSHYVWYMTYKNEDFTASSRQMCFCISRADLEKVWHSLRRISQLTKGNRPSARDVRCAWDSGNSPRLLSYLPWERLQCCENRSLMHFTLISSKIYILRFCGWYFKYSVVNIVLSLI